MMRHRIAFSGLLLAVTLAPGVSVFGQVSASDKSGKKKDDWRLAVQAWTFHQFTLSEAIDKVEKLDVDYIELIPGQPLSKAEGETLLNHESPVSVLAKAKIMLDKAGIKAVNYGVVALGNDEAADRKVFDFAKVMGIETIVSEPEPGSYELVDRLANEYGINVAIHNHPKDSRYWNPDTVLEALKGRSKRMGACADVGHWVRSGLDPVECLKKLDGRILCLHFKDLNKAAPDAHDVPWGTGISDTEAMLKELDRQGFSGVFSIEYEYNWNNSMPEVRECVEYFHRLKRRFGR